MSKVIRNMSVLLWALALLLGGAPARATEVFMIARAFDKTVTLPDGSPSAPIPMWGFALDADSELATIGAEVPTSPGPELAAPDGQLTVHLRNDLAVPVSIVIPGQIQALAPVRDAGGRVTSFAAETAPGATGVYTWASVAPGTYLYHSGTHPQVEVQMGLYGALRGAPYAGVAAGAEVVVVFSEIDPTLHAAVSSGNYGPGAAMTSTIDYEPRYFLLNGEAFWSGRPALPGAAAGESTLLRLVNAGLRTHVPVVQNGHLDVLAEDGHLYPYPRRQAVAMLPAGKTIDALWTPTANGTYVLFDRALGLHTDGRQGGGMVVHLEVGGPANARPVASSQSLAVVEDSGATAITLTAMDAENDALVYVIGTPPQNGILAGAPPNVTYTPNADFFGADSFTFTASDAGGASNVGTVSVGVTGVNDAPSFTLGASPSAAAGSGAQSLPSWATSISAGLGESGQTLTFTLTNDNVALFAVQPAISPNGTLTFTPAAASGTANVTVVAKDSGGVAGGGVDTSPPATFAVQITPSKHVGALTGTVLATPAGVGWTSRATVRAHDQAHVNLAGVVVTGRWNGAAVDSTCTTGATGVCTLSRLQPGAAASATFTVQSLGGAGGVYLASANHPGSSVTVNRPVPNP